MDALSFRNGLQEAKPTAELLALIGLNEEEAAGIAASFDVRERVIEQDNNLPDSALHNLFLRYDVSSVEVGMTRFLEVPEKVSYGYIIGEVEADYLTLEVDYGEVAVRDITSPDHIIWKCARDGASFLAAIAEAAKYLGACIAGDQSGSELQRQTLDRCLLFAGDPAYGGFYRMLLGVNSGWELR